MFCFCIFYKLYVLLLPNRGFFLFEGIRPYVPPDIYFFKWIEHPRTLSLASERVMASMESLDLNTSRCSTARTLTPREYYQKILLQYCKQVQPDEQLPAIDANETNENPEA